MPKTKRSHRYFFITSFIALLSVVMLLLLYRNLVFSSLVKQETRSNVDITHIFHNHIWPTYNSFLTTAEQLSVNELKRHPEIDRLKKDVKRMMGGSNVVKLKIYHPNGLTLFSTDAEQIGVDVSGNAGFMQAMLGSVTSQMTRRDSMDTFEGTVVDRNIVSSYIPMREGGVGNVEGVLEVYSDVTELFNQFSHTQRTITMATLFTLSFLLFWVLFSMRRADNVLRDNEKAHQEHVLELLQHAYMDPLTNLPNRKSFKGYMEDATSRASRADTVLAVFFLDLDGFKLVNDSMGHAQGDEVLRLVAKRLQGCIRDSDTLFRMGGDEFCIVHESLRDKNDAVPLIRRIHKAMSHPIEIGRQKAILGVSIGVAMYPDDSSQPESLLRDADAAMYSAKEKGRNQYCFFSQEMNERAKEQLHFEGSLFQAVENNEFVLHYQPRISGSKASEVVGVEALIRWKNKEGELIPPMEFIPVLERTGLIIQVGKWVLQEACRQNKAWQDKGMRPFRVSVNISFVQFQSGNLVKTVQQALEQSGLSAQYLELELTESILIDATDTNCDILHELKALGVSIAIDDFGTGYSSLSYLKSFPIDYLKIDRSFISDLPHDSKDAAITRAIASMAHELGIELVAEGVELSGNVDFLRGQGCHELQGYLISHPLPPHELMNYVREKAAIG